MSEIRFTEKNLQEADASKRYHIRSFLEAMDKVMSDPVEKQIIRTQFLDAFNKHHRFVESLINGSNHGKKKHSDKS